MKDRDRKQLLQLCERLHNWRQRSTKPLPAFVRWNREELDRLFADGAPGQGRPAKRAWRKWQELTPKEIDRLRRRIRTEPNINGAAIACLLEERIVADKDARAALHKLHAEATSYETSYGRWHSRVPDLRWVDSRQKAARRLAGPTQERLDRVRQERLQKQFNARFGKDNDRIEWRIAGAAFVANLDPDDAEFTILDRRLKRMTLVADRHCIAFTGKRLLPAGKNRPRLLFGYGPLGEVPILARQHYLTDQETGAEVYYCATITVGRDKEGDSADRVPRLERRYIGRVKGIEGTWLFTNKFIKARDAMKAARLLYAKNFASRIRGA